MEGYDDLACHMARFADLTIVRRFSALRCKVLLQLQSEIMHKEKELTDAIKRDRESNDLGREVFAFDNHAMLTAPSPPDDAPKGQQEILEEIRPFLREYGTWNPSVLALSR